MKKRTAHNKGKSRINLVGGRHAYIDKKRRFDGLILLLMSMALTIGIKWYYAPTEELLSPIPVGS